VGAGQLFVALLLLHRELFAKALSKVRLRRGLTVLVGREVGADGAQLARVEPSGVSRD
jgi:hypothetical protein